MYDTEHCVDCEEVNKYIWYLQWVTLFTVRVDNKTP